MVDYLASTAMISPCGAYRYALTRTWDDNLPLALFCMLNPSTADAADDDATIRKCVSYARKWGHGGLVVVNLFALRATDPRELYRHPDPVGPDNDAILLKWGSQRIPVAAWGTHGALHDRGAFVRRMLEPLRVLRLTKDGHPAHPLYLPGGLQPVSWDVNKVQSSTPFR